MIAPVIGGIATAAGGYLAGRGVESAGKSVESAAERLSTSIDKGVSALQEELHLGVAAIDRATNAFMFADKACRLLLEQFKDDIFLSLGILKKQLAVGLIILNLWWIAVLTFFVYALIKAYIEKVNLFDELYICLKRLFRYAILFAVGMIVGIPALKVFVLFYMIPRTHLLFIGCVAAAIWVKISQTQNIALPSLSGNFVIVFMLTMFCWGDSPYGSLMPYYGVGERSIPTGWVLADGTNGTPDLNDRFICGSSKLNTFTKTEDPSVNVYLPAHDHDHSSWNDKCGDGGIFDTLFDAFTGMSYTKCSTSHGFQAPQCEKRCPRARSGKTGKTGHPFTNTDGGIPSIKVRLPKPKSISMPMLMYTGTPLTALFVLVLSSYVAIASDGLARAPLANILPEINLLIAATLSTCIVVLVRFVKP